MDFCHIAPTPHLGLTKGRPVHLVLAHLIEQDDSYVQYYLEQKEKYNCTIIMDNSAFEMYKQNKPMYEPSQLLPMAKRINADYIVMTDYPGHESIHTINEAKTLAPLFKDAGFMTFFVPQGNVGDVEDLLRSFTWAVENPQHVDYIGISILSAPLAYDVEKGNKLQRFASRLRLMYELKQQRILEDIAAAEVHGHQKQKVHLLGMVDGPNEIMFMQPFADSIDTWDSSAGVWAGLNGISFDATPTGLRSGKFEKEVDFNFETSDTKLIAQAESNMKYIDNLCKEYL